MGTVDEQTQAMIDNLPEKTGKSLQEWIATLAPLKAEKHGVVMAELKGPHGVTHGYANLISMMLRRSASVLMDGGDLVEGQYSGPKAGLRPIYDRLAAAVGDFGDDVELSPKKAYVSLRRSKQFALIQPSTKTRVDLGVNLKGVEPSGRLEASGSFNSMVSHRVRLSSVDELDEEVLQWLKDAYERA